MSSLAASDNAGTWNATPVKHLGESDRQPAKVAAALLVVITTGTKAYGVAVLLKFPIPSFAVTVVAPGPDLSSGRQR